jgi:hypothetical protein
MPFECQPALGKDVVLFVDRTVGYVRPPLSSLARASSERLIPTCRSDEPTGVDAFTWL